MSELRSHDALRHAFRAIAEGGIAPTSLSVPSLYLALSDAVDEMRKAGVSIERVVNRVKALASEAGIRETHDNLVTNAVLWSIDHYYRDEDTELLLRAKRERRDGYPAAVDSSAMITTTTRGSVQEA